jgi:hypothetical protein
MSSERKELLRIHSLLVAGRQAPDELDTATNSNDLELLRSVLALVRQSKSLTDQLDESLAFDSETRRLMTDERALAEVQQQLWQPLDKFDDQLRRDYTCRRQMLLSRLDCTIESFKWKGANNAPPKGGKAKSMNEQIHEVYDRARLNMKDEPQVSISHLLAVRQSDCDRLLNGIVGGSTGLDCMISYGNKGSTQSGELVNLKHVIIPNVPDRGGRTDDRPPPPKETFGQQRAQRGGGGRQFSRHHGQRERRR